MTNSKIGNNLEDIRKLLNIEQPEQELGTDYGWFVGATGNNDEGVYTDFSEQYIEEKRWENRYDDKFIDIVKSIQVGDKIAMKSSYTRKKDLPFNNNGHVVGVMAIKAIGIVTENEGDGKNIKVDWQRIDPIKEWYGKGQLMKTIHLIKASDGLTKKLLLQFTFNDIKQDYSLCEEQYADDIEEMDKSEMDIDLDENDDMKSCVDIVRSPRTNTIHPLNFIIYGAPGTGKTYSTAEYALAILENREADLSEKSNEERKEIINKYKKYVKENRIVFTTFHQNYGYEEFIQGLRPDKDSDNMSFKIVDGVFKNIADRALNDEEDNNNYVIIIDEINRANISKVFGELITLIEADKRWGEINETSAVLQSGDVFAVPNNLYIVGTMNSADKSISLIDAALRRRFDFVEQTPNSTLVKDETLKKVLEVINTKLVKDLDSTDLLVGHSYFMNKTKDDLCKILNNNIIPLAYEYYYDDRKRVIGLLKDMIEKTDINIEIQDDAVGRLKVKETE